MAYLHGIGRPPEDKRAVNYVIGGAGTLLFTNRAISHFCQKLAIIERKIGKLSEKLVSVS
jgi:hypothetical protein